nr:hypothetical protein Iba_chr11aCG12090 [Ipomoea batatas]
MDQKLRVKDGMTVGRWGRSTIHTSRERYVRTPPLFKGRNREGALRKSGRREPARLAEGRGLLARSRAEQVRAVERAAASLPHPPPDPLPPSTAFTEIATTASSTLVARGAREQQETSVPLACQPQVTLAILPAPPNSPPTSRGTFALPPP